jgi:DNA-binding GntR family transcriptional regulator
MSIQGLNMTPVAGLSESLTDQVVLAVRDAVASGRMTPDTLYSVYQLAAELGVSRSPVREALLRLAEVGLVVIERNRGFHVVLPQPREIAEIFAVRIALEVPAVEFVATPGKGALSASLRQELDEALTAADEGDESSFSIHDRLFHDTILRAAGNERARRIVTELRETTRLLGASTADHVRTLYDIHQEHGPIVEAIVASDAGAARGAMLWHLTNTGILLVKQQIERQRLDLDAEAIWSEVVKGRSIF